MKRTVSPRATAPDARAHRLSTAQLQRVTAGLPNPQPQIVDFPDPQDWLVIRPLR
jgi:hypothetical protein